MALTVFWVEYITGETPGSTPHDTFSFKTGGDPIPTVTAATNINFGNVSARDLVPGTDPIPAGSNSFDKYFTLQFSGSFTQVSNAKLWKSAGTYVTGETIQFSGNIAYGSPSTTDALDPLIPTAAPASANVGLVFKDSSDLLAPTRTLPASYEVASSPGYYSGSRSSIMRFQSLTTASSPAGPTATKTFSLTYDRS